MEFPFKNHCSTPYSSHDIIFDHDMNVCDEDKGLDLHNKLTQLTTMCVKPTGKQTSEGLGKARWMDQGRSWSIPLFFGHQILWPFFDSSKSLSLTHLLQSCQGQKCFFLRSSVPQTRKHLWCSAGAAVNRDRGIGPEPVLLRK